MLSTMILFTFKFYGLVEFNLGFFMQIFNTLVLFAFLHHFLFTPVTKVMDDRTNKIQKAFDDADVKLEQSEKLRLSYEKKLEEIRDEREQIIKEAELKANKLSEELKQETQEEIKKMKENAAKEIEADREKMMDDVKDEIASISILIASKVLAKELKTGESDIVINEFINKVGDVKWDR